MPTCLHEQPALVRSLLDPAAYPFPCSTVELVETHISWVFLTGRFAYKVKKPVNFGFLDFSTLARRLHFCHEELRLNNRLAGEIYIEVVPICGSPERAKVEASGEAFEYAVKMHQFDQSQLLSRQLEEGRLAEWQVDRLAAQTAELHAGVARSSSKDPHGTPTLVHSPSLENFEQISPLLSSPQRLERLQTLGHWTEAEFIRLRACFVRRKENGYVRECHGDLHLGNVTQKGEEILLFDGIEFNDNFRWIDVMSEIAFLFTDLEHRGRPDFAWRYLNRYLELTGDFEGLDLFRYYRLYRIMVRTKIDCLRLQQPGLEPQQRDAIEADLDHYLAQAERTVRPERPLLLLMRGLSGSGKSFFSQSLAQCMGAVRIRSDVERKRLLGLSAQARSQSTLGGGLYSRENTQRTFERLRYLAGALLKSGYPTIIDATFLHLKNIEPFLALATDLGLPFKVLDIRTPEKLLRARLARRSLDSEEASEAGQEVLSSQLKSYHPLEEPYALALAGDRAWKSDELVDLVTQLRMKNMDQGTGPE